MTECTCRTGKNRKGKNIICKYCQRNNQIPVLEVPQLEPPPTDNVVLQADTTPFAIPFNKTIELIITTATPNLPPQPELANTEDPNQTVEPHIQTDKTGPDSQTSPLSEPLPSLSNQVANTASPLSKWESSAHIYHEISLPNQQNVAHRQYHQNLPVTHKVMH